MENFEISKEKLLKIKDGIIFMLLFLWMIMPILQCFKVVYNIINLEEIYFILMKIIGAVGIGLSIFCIYDKIKNAKNKKGSIKEILPIFIFILYMIWTLIACFYSPYKRTAFYGNFYRKEGYYMYLNYAGYFLCAFLLDNKKLRKKLLNAFLITSVFLIFISRITLDGQRFTNIFVNSTIDKTIFSHFNHYGYYLMMSFICCLGLFITEKNRNLKIVYLIVYAIIGYATIYNYTFGCYLSIAVILILYGIYALLKKRDRKTVLIAIMVFAILSGITYREGDNVAYKNIRNFAKDVKTIFFKITNIQIEEDEKKEAIEESFEMAGTSRMKLWTNGIQFILERPLLGYGPDNLRPKYADVGINQDRPHNLIIQLATTSGIPGMLLYVIAVGIIVVKGIIKLFKNNGNGKIFLIIVLTYLISAMFGNSMYYTSPYFFIFLGSLMHFNLIGEE